MFLLSPFKFDVIDETVIFDNETVWILSWHIPEPIIVTVTAAVTGAGARLCCVHGLSLLLLVLLFTGALIAVFLPYFALMIFGDFD